MANQDPINVKLDSEFGLPLIEGVQSPICIARMCEQGTDRVVTETMVFPNLIVFWLVDPETGTHVGDSRFCSPQFAALMPSHLIEVAEHVNNCDSHNHGDKYMYIVGPEEA